MVHEPTSTLRARRLRKRRSRGVVMVAPVEIGRGGVALLVGNGFLKQHQADDRHAVGEACLAALEQCRGSGCTVHGTGLEPSDRASHKLMGAQAY
jgi:hypothetical protein